LLAVLAVGSAPDDSSGLVAVDAVEPDLLARLVHRVAAEADRVVAVVPTWLPPAVHDVIDAVRASSRGSLVAYDTRLPPAGAAVLAVQAAHLARQGAGVGVVLAALPALERRVRTVAWLRSVTGLRRPDPGSGSRRAWIALSPVDVRTCPVPWREPWRPRRRP
jgi:hypothetical protein